MITYPSEQIRKYASIIMWWLLTGLSGLNAAPDPLFNHLTINDGLPSNSIRALSQDRYGRLWIGNGRGVAVYDGHSIMYCRGLPPNIGVLSLHETAERMWIGTDVGLFFLDFSTDSIHALKTATTDGIVPSSSVLDIKRDSSGKLWFTTFEQGVFCWDESRNTLTNPPLPYNEKRANCLLVDTDGNVWSFSPWGTDVLSRYNTSSRRFEAYPLIVDGKPHRIGGLVAIQDPQGYIYLGADDGYLYRFRPGSHEAEQLRIGDDVQTIHCLQPVSQHEIVVGSINGLTFVDTQTLPSQPSPLTPQPSAPLTDRNVYSMLLDREGTLWVGTYYGGLNYTNPEYSNFVYYESSGIVPPLGKTVSSFAEANDGSVWVGSNEGLAIFDPSSSLFHSFADAAGAKIVETLHLKDNHLLVGSYLNGLVDIDLTTHRILAFPVLCATDGRKIDSSVHSIFTDRDGIVWIGTFNNICTYDVNTSSFCLIKDSTYVVNHISQDNDRRLWFATFAHGVLRYDKQLHQWKSYSVRSSNDERPCSCFTVFNDAKGKLWLGTSQGLFYYDASRDDFVPVPLGLSDPEINDIVEIAGELWMTSSVGLIHYLPAHGQIAQIYRVGGGLESVDFIQGALFRSRDNRIFVGTSDGFCTFQPQRMRSNAVPPKVMFTGLDLFGKPVDVGGHILSKPIIQTDTIHLAHNEKVIRIHFSAMSLVSPKNNQYRYRLEGFDDDWHEAGHESNATYTNLSPGTYVLHVQASNNDGVWSTKDATLTIIVTPPFYWNTPAKILYLLLIIGAITFGVRELLRRRERRHQAEIEKLNKQAAEEIHEARIQFMSLTEDDKRFLGRIEEVIEGHYHEPDLSVDVITEAVFMSRASLYARLKKISDVTPNEMIQQIRLRHAESLLKTGRYRVNEVCYEVGFSNPSYFSKCFQKRYGLTPAEYMKSGTGEESDIGNN